jgi:tetratricopeptide (TPR) repeat protein
MARRLAAQPNAPTEAIALWGVAAAEAGDFAEAIEALGRAEPGRAREAAQRSVLDIQLGRSLIALGRWREGLEVLADAERQPPTDPPLRHRLGLALAGAGRFERALPHLWFAAERRPADAACQADLAWVFAVLGRVDEAERQYERAIALAPAVTRAHAGLATLRRWTYRRNHIARLTSLQESAREPVDRVEIGYALFKELDDLGRREEAWRVLSDASAAAFALAPWSADDDSALVEALISAFPAERFAAARTAPGVADGPRPIFVVGLPRTGTTLVERILASHRAVASLGEAPFFPLAFRAASGSPIERPITAATVQAARDADWAVAGDAYRRQIAALADGADVVVDKLPFNSMLAGAIRLALPEARIVLVERDPLDSLWSAHRNPFALGGWYGWTRRQSDLAAHHANHQRLMDHWRAVLGDALVTLRYEDLVQDPVRAIGRLLASCDLSPDPACFEPHKARGAVATLSQAAVRAPINPGSIGAWKAYAEPLAPLRAALAGQTV